MMLNTKYQELKLSGFRQEDYKKFHLGNLFLASMTYTERTSKPPLDIFSYILTYLIHKGLKFTHNMEKLFKTDPVKISFS